MKLKHILTPALLALSGAALLSSSAKAQIVTAVNNDLIIGFEATSGQGSSENFEIDIGPAASLTNGEIFNTGSNLSGALSAIYGSGWASNGNINWGIVGWNGGGGASTAKLWASAAEGTPGTQSAPWPDQNGLAGAKSLIQELYTAGDPSALNNQPAYAGFTNAAEVDATAAGAWTYSKNTQPGDDFNFFNPTVQAPLSSIAGAGSLLDGTSYSVLDLYAIDYKASDVSAHNVGTLVGEFGLNSNGQLIYESPANIGDFAPVPEPSTYAAFAGVAALGFVMIRRRKNKA